jgi:hypothetical protein
MHFSTFRELPSLPDQINLLRATGEQFHGEEKRARRLVLPGVRMPDPDNEPMSYDGVIVPAIPTLIAPDKTLFEALRSVRPDTKTHQNPGTYISSIIDEPRLIVGFSGYGTEGFAYETEYVAINGIFDHLDKVGRSVAIVDGGTGYGVPGLSGALARQRSYPTTGYIPARSLRGALPRGKRWLSLAAYLAKKPMRLAPHLMCWWLLVAARLPRMKLLQRSHAAAR